MILQTTDDKVLNIQVTENEKNQDILIGTAGADRGAVVRSIKNLSTIAKLAQSEKLDLPKVYFVKVNFFGTDLLTL